LGYSTEKKFQEKLGTKEEKRMNRTVWSIFVEERRPKGEKRGEIEPIRYPTHNGIEGKKTKNQKLISVGNGGVNLKNKIPTHQLDQKWGVGGEEGFAKHGTR